MPHLRDVYKRQLDGRIGPGVFQTQKRGDRLGNDLLAFALRARAPGLPVETEELVEDKRAF